jgi:ribosomal protein S1
MVMDRQLVDAPDDGYWQSLLQDAEQADDFAAQNRPVMVGPPQAAPALVEQHVSSLLHPVDAGQLGRRADDYALGESGRGSRPSAVEHAPAHDAQWQWAQEVFARDESVEGVVTGFNRGGLLVKVREMAGFVPASHMVGLTRWTTDQDRAQQLGRRIGEAIRLKVIELSREQNRFILSERLAMGRQKDGELLLHTLKVGDVCSGKVNHITEFGAFVDLGGIDGLIHVSEIAWERVSHPRDILRLGQEVQVVVVSIDPAKRRIQLSIKRLPTDPWSSVPGNNY